MIQITDTQTETPYPGVWRMNASGISGVYDLNYLWKKRWPFNIVGFDTETNITDQIQDRVMYVATVGNYDEQIVVDWVHCPPEAQDWVKSICENPDVVKIIHNVSFDLKVLWNHGITARNTYDTMVQHQLLHNGIAMKNISLAELHEQYLYKFLDKGLRTSYNGEKLSDEQIKYAGLDVKELPTFRLLQLFRGNEYHLVNAMGLENEVAEALARMEYDGVILDPDRWKEAKMWADGEFYRVRQELQNTVEADPRLAAYAVENGYIMVEDKMNINWNSAPQKKEIALHFFPGLTGLSKPILKAVVESAYIDDNLEAARLFEDTLNGNYKTIEEYLLKTDRQWLIDHEMLYPAGLCRFNWNSSVQMLALCKLLDPRLRSTEAKYLAKRADPFFKALVTYGEWFKRVSTYGEDFLRHIQKDGRVHTRYHNIKDTGRTSSSDPNLQNIPARGAAKSHYRRPFIPAPGNLLCKGDYAGQEIVLAAQIYRETSWINALKAGHDIHSVVAEMIWPKEWKVVAEPECTYYLNNAKHKCKCASHDPMRGSVKTLNFGIIYGMSAAGLSERLGISRNDAQKLIDDYFRALPNLRKNMRMFVAYALSRGYIRGPGPISRIRWFPDWEQVRHRVPAYLAGASDDYILAEIARQAGNMPVQGGGADVLKIAMVLIYQYIRDNNLFGIVKMVLNVHDELVCEYPETMIEWPRIQSILMKRAADVVVPSGLLNAELKTAVEWEK